MRGEAKEVSLAVASQVETLRDLQNLHDKAPTIHKGTCSEASLAASLQLADSSRNGELPEHVLFAFPSGWSCLDYHGTAEKRRHVKEGASQVRYC